MLTKIILSQFLGKGAVGHVVDNHLRDTVTEPAIGSIVYCDLVFGSSEHSGVYLGGGEIVHLNRDGKIQRVTSEEFVSNTTALSIYVSCRGSEPVGGMEIADRAEIYRKAVIARNYNVILDNCHQFAAACLIGEPNNANNFLWMLKHECEKQLSVDSWRVWERPWAFSTRRACDEKMSASELEKLIRKKMKLNFELIELSFALSEERMSHLDHFPVDGPFFESRSVAWDKKQALLEKRTEGVDEAGDHLNNEIYQLEQQLAALNTDR